MTHDVTNEEFEKLIANAMDELPQKYIAGLNNVLITYEDLPTEEQRRRQKLQVWQTLFGLYEGVPRTRRGNNYTMVLPDRITIFRLPMLNASADMQELKENIKRTLWHEIAHYYGLGHDRIHELENHSSHDH